jgi:hypothetical protein
MELIDRNRRYAGFKNAISLLKAAGTASNLTPRNLPLSSFIRVRIKF